MIVTKNLEVHLFRKTFRVLEQFSQRRPPENCVCDLNSLKRSAYFKHSPNLYIKAYSFIKHIRDPNTGAPLSFAKFLRISFLQNTYQRLLLYSLILWIIALNLVKWSLHTLSLANHYRKISHFQETIMVCRFFQKCKITFS